MRYCARSVAHALSVGDAQMTGKGSPGGDRAYQSFGKVIRGAHLGAMFDDVGFDVRVRCAGAARGFERESCWQSRAHIRWPAPAALNSRTPGRIVHAEDAEGGLVDQDVDRLGHHAGHRAHRVADRGMFRDGHDRAFNRRATSG